MKPSLRIASLLLAVIVGAGGSFMVTHVTPAHAAESSAAANSVTVFVDATLGFRKDHMARQLTKSHAKYAAQGYHFAQMVAYDENGDLQGFFVTYVRNP